MFGQVLFEDDDLLIVNKPQNLRVAPIHRWQGSTLHGRAVAHLGRPPHIIHRLDMNTTGVTAFAKNKQAARSLAHQFRTRECSKDYLALCQRTRLLPASSFVVDQPLLAHGPGSEVLQRVHCDGLLAQTRVEVLAEVDGSNGASCLIKASPITGRMHQIRVHLAHSGVGIWGDDLYGHVDEAVIARQALHAVVLRIVHPKTHEQLTIAAQLPQDFRDAIETVGLAQYNDSYLVQSE